MRYTEVKKMEQQEVVYHLLLFKLVMYKEQLEKVTLFRKKNAKGRLISSVTCYLSDCNGNTHMEHYRLYDNEYLWFVCALQQDFPDLDFKDLTTDESKAVKDEV